LSCQKTDRIEVSGDSTLKAEVIPLPNSFRFPLGSGYVSKTGTILNTACLAPGDKASSVDIIPYPEGQLKGGFSESRKTVIDKLSVSVSASANAGFVKGSGSASLDVSFAESDLKTASYLSYDYRAGNAYLRYPKIKANANGIVVNRDLGKIAAQCGDEVVYRVDLGARFHVGLEYTFASKELKDEMKAKLKLKGPAGVTLFSLNESHSGTAMDRTLATLNLVVYQEGGDQNAFKSLSQNIPKNCTVEVKEGKLARKSFQQCADFYQNKILPYMQREFPEQVKKLAYEGKEGLNVLRYYTKRYDAFGYPELQTEINLPQKVKVYQRTKLKAFDQDVFKVAAFLRSIILGIGGSASIERPPGLNLDPGRLSEIRLELERLQSAGQLGLDRCRGLVQDYIMKAPHAQGDFEDVIRPCDADYDAFKAHVSELVNSQTGIIPSVYLSNF
jgi:hypothetical protein